MESEQPIIYKVFVDDNFHYMDEEERYQLGTFETLDAAVGVCKQIVDEFLLSSYKPGMKSEELYNSYISFGEDPFIVGRAQERPFSAWDYAKQRSQDICSKNSRG